MHILRSAEPYTFKQKAPMLLADDPSLEVCVADFNEAKTAPLQFSHQGRMGVRARVGLQP